MDDEQRERVLAATIVIVVAAVIVGFLVWLVLANYIKPVTATQRKDLVHMFILSAAGIIGFSTALAAFGNLYVSRTNLQQQRDLDDRRAQDDALQDYFGQMGELLTTHELMETTHEDDPKRLLARAHTLTVLRRVRGSRRKSDVALFLEGAGLINKDNTIVSLRQADLRRADLSEANLSDASLSSAFLNHAFLVRTDLSGASLSDADLRRAFLSDADLSGAFLNDADLRDADLVDADLSGTDLSGAFLSGAFLRGAKGVTNERLEEQAKTLEGTTMPDGTKHP